MKFPLPPQTSSAFSSTSWVDYLLLTTTGNKILLALLAVCVVVTVTLVASTAKCRDVQRKSD